MAIFNLSGGGQPVLQLKQATPSKSQQIILPDEGYDGLSEVDIDATPLETRTVNPSTSSQTITPSSSSIGFSSVTVNPIKLQSKSVTPPTVPYSVSPDSGYNGLSSVIFGKDANLIASNIASGKSIFGVTGNAKIYKHMYITVTSDGLGNLSATVTALAMPRYVDRLEIQNSNASSASYIYDYYSTSGVIDLLSTGRITQNGIATTSNTSAYIGTLTVTTSYAAGSGTTTISIGPWSGGNLAFERNVSHVINFYGYDG